jgi:hypothetical protein
MWIPKLLVSFKNNNNNNKIKLSSYIVLRMGNYVIITCLHLFFSYCENIICFLSERSLKIEDFTSYLNYPPLFKLNGRSLSKVKNKHFLCLLVTKRKKIKNRENFFQNLTLGYMTKTLNQIIFFSSASTSFAYLLLKGKKLK